MAFCDAGTGGSVYVVRLRHMHLLRMEDQGNTHTHTMDTKTKLAARFDISKDDKLFSL